MTVGKRILAGIGQMSWPAVGSAIVAVLVYAAKGNPPSPRHAPLGELLTFYAFIAVSCGSVLGLLEPLTRRPLGRALAYTAAALPFAFGLVFWAKDLHWEDLDRIDAYFTLGIAVFVGPVAAAYVEIRAREARSR